jgi:hypothetical protein
MVGEVFFSVVLSQGVYVWYHDEFDEITMTL